ncbi:uncharacterized protein G2W53_044436 [Senna tora]|uniref:Uncharacterized protein n=1 Tax=Senna tora TaxID=362788 RepID=A0A834SCI8_9FABA|nr:uncharacterized protein G2W53_044436 [Senna tora]
MAVRNSFDGESVVKSVSDRSRPSEKFLTDLRSVRDIFAAKKTNQMFDGLYP